jgi:hypothetical protein
VKNNRKMTARYWFPTTGVATTHLVPYVASYVATSSSSSSSCASTILMGNEIQIYSVSSI